MDSRPALAALCEAYWHPVYAFIRRSGYAPDHAQDLTQGFFALLLEKNFLEVVDPHRGRFRSFLLTAVKRFLLNERDRAYALKRGGGECSAPLDLIGAENWYVPSAANVDTPERLFELQWALALLERAMTRLRVEFTAAGKSSQFDTLAPFLSRESVGVRYEELTPQMGVSAGALRALVHRMRRRYRDLLRAEIANSVAEPEEVDEEIQFLMSVLSS